MCNFIRKLALAIGVALICTGLVLICTDNAEARTTLGAVLPQLCGTIAFASGMALFRLAEDFSED